MDNWTEVTLHGTKDTQLKRVDSIRKAMLLCESDSKTWNNLNIIATSIENQLRGDK